MSVPQLAPVSIRWLSTTPSQSSSQPLQVSGCGTPARLQLGQFLQHEPGAKGVQSSTTPLQSLSKPSQVSVAGQSSGWAASHSGALQLSPSWSAEQMKTPVAKQWVPATAPLLQTAALRLPSPFGPPQPAGSATSGKGS